MLVCCCTLGVPLHQAHLCLEEDLQAFCGHVVGILVLLLMVLMVIAD